MTFSTPRTPTRVRLTSVWGRRAWTSGLEVVEAAFMVVSSTKGYRCGFGGRQGWHTGNAVPGSAVLLGTACRMAEELEQTLAPGGERQSEELAGALIAAGRERGYVTVEQVAAALEEVELGADGIKELHSQLTDAGLEVIGDTAAGEN